MSGSAKFQIARSDRFERSLEQLLRNHYRKDRKNRESFQEALSKIVEELSLGVTPRGARPEPWPHGSHDPDLQFMKLRFDLPGLRGAAGQGRLMYLVSPEEQVVVLLWIYTHAEFGGRPPDKDLAQLLAEYRRAKGEQ